MYEEIKDKLSGAQMVLVGIGERANLTVEDYNKLVNFLGEVNYFIVDLCDNPVIEESQVNQDKLVMPVYNEDSERWDTYLKWLAGTLNRELVVLELGVGFDHPDLVRFPFEKTVMYNNKAYMIRVNNNLYQLPSELKDKGCTAKCTATDFIRSL